MDNNIDNLKKLFDSLKSMGFWERLFSWSRIKIELIDATADLQKVLTNYNNLETHNQTIEQNYANLSKDHQISNSELIRKQSEIEVSRLKIQESMTDVSRLTSLISSANTSISNLSERINGLLSDNRLFSEKNTNLDSLNKKLSENEAMYVENITNLTKRKNELDIELTNLKKDLERFQYELSEVKNHNIQLLAVEESRKSDYNKQTSTLKEIQDSIQEARSREIQDRHDTEIERLNNLKLTWSNHQESARRVVKSLCSKHTIEYIDKVPFKGEPDNTVKICGEYVIFDAKSPRGEDLKNFPLYLKDQSEKAKKYAKEEDVKKWIFFIVPSNTFEVLTNFVYPMADYEVFIIALDSLEPVLLSLKKIEEYDFAEQLNPEDRENICRVLGKFAHLSKRRIQIDTYFINQFMELAYKCESDLPLDILDKVKEFEKAEKLNPPQEKRVKAISITDLEKSTKKLRMDANSKGIMIEDETISTGLNDLPLYKLENE